MPGVVFLIVIPTANFERELVYGIGHGVLAVSGPFSADSPTSQPAAGTAAVVNSVGSNNLNINLADGDNGNNAVLRLEVELRDKNATKYRRGGGAVVRGAPKAAMTRRPIGDKGSVIVPLEKVLEELLEKLEIAHVTWTTSKKGFYHHVIFPLSSGEPCETTLHCLTELGIGTKLNSSVNVIPCSVSYDTLNETIYSNTDSDEVNEEYSKWRSFVESIKSKLTVKQVVDGVRSGGSLSFDYLLLIVTADSLAALGLVENNASNIVAAMLVSPLMGPVMSITFGAIISDRELMRVGFISLVVGMFISCLFGFIFGLILGTTEMPWGNGDWPTEEMRARGNARSLWMGVLWALTSGTGVAVALLQGSAGPLIGVAISASLLPPLVNCGLFWALACIWLIYPGIRIPHLKGEAHDGNSSYPFLYTDYLPTEFLINGIVSGLLTVINVICIFITAIILLKIKEVSAPYTASPDLKRFWVTDLRTVRKTNRSTIRHRKTTFREKKLPYQGLDEPRNHELDTVLKQALQEAENDVTFRKVKRMSYSSNANDEVTKRLAKIASLSCDKQTADSPMAKGQTPPPFGTLNDSQSTLVPGTKVKADLKAVEKLLSNLLEHHATEMDGDIVSIGRGSTRLSRRRPTSHSMHIFAPKDTNAGDAAKSEHGHTQHTPLMPTIAETATTGNNVARSLPRTSSKTSKAFTNAPHTFNEE